MRLRCYNSYMIWSLPEVVTLLQQYQYALLFPIAVIEGPIISVIASFLVSISQMNFWIAYAVLILGDLLGDGLLYALGRWGSNSILPKFGPRIGITPQRMARVEEIFRKHNIKTLLFGKWSHTFGLIILTAAGATKQKFSKFLLINFIGTVPKSLFLILVGYYFGQGYQKINSYINDAVWIMGAAVVLGIGFYYLITKLAKKYFN